VPKTTKRKLATSSTGGSKVSSPVAASRLTTTSLRARRGVVKRAVPVSTALKSLVPSLSSSVVVAQNIHRAPTMSAIRVRTTPTNSHRADVRDVVLALLMAIGLSTVFLSPLRFTGVSVASAPTTVGGGRILGEAVTVPLSVQVSIHQGDQQWRVMTSPRGGTLAEALGQAAGAVGSSFAYLSRGSSIYLQQFMNVTNDLTGSWVVRVNGLSISDLSSRPLE